jgi:hypothetical protein
VFDLQCVNFSQSCAAQATEAQLQHLHYCLACVRASTLDPCVHHASHAKSTLSRCA